MTDTTEDKWVVEDWPTVMDEPRWAVEYFDFDPVSLNPAEAFPELGIDADEAAETIKGIVRDGLEDHLIDAGEDVPRSERSSEEKAFMIAHTLDDVLQQFLQRPYNGDMEPKEGVPAEGYYGDYYEFLDENSEDEKDFTRLRLYSYLLIKSTAYRALRSQGAFTNLMDDERSFLLNSVHEDVVMPDHAVELFEQSAKADYLDRIELKAGTTIKRNGVPFELEEGTVVLGLVENIETADELGHTEYEVLEEDAVLVEGRE